MRASFDRRRSERELVSQRPSTLTLTHRDRIASGTEISGAFGNYVIYQMSDRETTLKMPPRWTGDSLSSFVTDAFKNSLATFVHKRAEFDLLISVDECFQSISKNLANPASFLAALFLLRSHSAFRGAARFAMSGQAPETFPILRSCIEYALYALHIDCDQARAEVWIRRHDDDAALRKCKQEFQHVRVIKTLELADAQLHRAIHALYERTIDFGAHPSERGVSGSTRFGDDDIVQSMYLSGGNSLELVQAMKATAQLGVGALSIFERIFRDRFRMLGLDAKLYALRATLS